jgi:hypothetical protein
MMRHLTKAVVRERLTPAQRAAADRRTKPPGLR